MVVGSERCEALRIARFRRYLAGLDGCPGLALGSHSGLGVRSSRGCQYTAPDSTASVASRSFLTLATVACAGFPVKDSMSLALRMARLQSLRSAVKETSIAM